MVKSQVADREAEPFCRLVLRHRGRTGLTQRALAARMGASRRTVQDWEAGGNYPSAELLQTLIVALLEAGGLTVGHEREEAEEVWAAVLREAPRMRTPLDEVWLTVLLAERGVQSDVVERRQDWGEAPDVLGFVGRAEELATLRRWVLEEGSRLVAVLGMGASARRHSLRGWPRT